MTKSIFMKKLEERLAGMDPGELKIVLAKYETLIDIEVKRGRKQKDIINDFGSLDMIAKLYLGENASTNQSTTGKIKRYGVINNLVDYIDDLFDKLDHNIAKYILEIIGFIVVGFILLSVVSLPFTLVDFVVSNVFDSISNNRYIDLVYHVLWTTALCATFVIIVIRFVVEYIKRVIEILKDK